MENEVKNEGKAKKWARKYILREMLNCLFKTGTFKSSKQLLLSLTEINICAPWPALLRKQSQLSWFAETSNTGLPLALTEVSFSRAMHHPVSLDYPALQTPKHINISMSQQGCWSTRCPHLPPGSVTFDLQYPAVVTTGFLKIAWEWWFLILWKLWNLHKPAPCPHTAKLPKSNSPKKTM